MIKKVAIFSVFMGLSLYLASCGGEEVSPSSNAVGVNFASSPEMLSEADIGVDVEIRTNTSVKELGKIQIALGGDAEYGVDYETDPAAINGVIEVLFPATTDFATFRIMPIENNDKNFDVSVECTLTNASGGVKVGSSSRFIQRISNVDLVREATFSEVGYVVTEAYGSMETKEIKLYWSRELLQEGTVTVSVEETNLVHGVHYTVDQEIVDGKITLTAEPNSSEASIYLNIIDNDAEDGHKRLDFRIIDATGGLRIGSDMREFFVDIIDDESPQEINFSHESSTVYEMSVEHPGSVYIDVERELKVAGTVDVVFDTDAVYGEDYSTYPEAPDGRLTFDLYEGFNGGSFTVFAINNDVPNAPRTIKFRLENPQGGVIMGTENPVHTVTIIDEED